VPYIKFEMVDGESSFLDPRSGFGETVEKFQVRFDPLTGRTGHLSHFGAIKPQRLPLDNYDLPEIKGKCPFCPDVRSRTTPKFPDRVLPEGRAERGEAVLIPNLFPYDVYSSVIIMTDDHVVPLDRLSEKRIHDAFSLGADFLKKMGSLDSSLPYHVITWNYMPPAGGGLVHPHLQCSAAKYPGNRYMDELSASKRFHDDHGINYWQEYVEEEKRIGTRYIASMGSSHWLSSFLSSGVLGEVCCVFPNVFDVNGFGTQDCADLSAGLGRVFAYYREHGIYSFNALLCFGPVSQRYFSCSFRIIPRTFLNTRDYAPDAGFYQMLLSEPVCAVSPEQLCEDLRPYF